MNKTSNSPANLATFSSPTTTFSSPGKQSFQDINVGCQKGCLRNSSRRHSSTAAAAAATAGMMPLSSGRTLPSKWEDAERWITSPVLGYGGSGKTSICQVQNRPKSLSGPLGLPGIANYSPSMVALEGGGGGGGGGGGVRTVRNYTVPGSPFSTGVIMAPDDIFLHYGGLQKKQSGAISASAPGCTDLVIESSAPSSQDEKLDGTKDEENAVSRDVSRRDMATQMSQEGSSIHSSPGRWSLSSPTFIPAAVEPASEESTKSEMRDVQVDKWATVLRQWSKRYGSRISKKQHTREVEELYRSAEEEDRTWPWDIAEATKIFQREEAKITAWENLQKAKAEAAIRKLEMNLEKKRSLSMDKILKKLRVAEMKAQEMRSSISERQTHKVHKNKNFWIGSLQGCFTCHAC